MPPTKPARKHWIKPTMEVVHLTEARSGGTGGPIDGIVISIPPTPIITFAS